MLRRIPAVNWAFSRLRPLPHNGVIDAAPTARDASPVAELVAAQAPIAELGPTSMRVEPDLAGKAPVTEDDATASVVAETPPDETCINDEPSPERPTEIDPPAPPPALDEVLAAPAVVESEPVAHPTIADDDALPRISTEIESVPMQEVVVSSADEITTSTEDVVVEAASPLGVSADVGPVTIEVAKADRLATDVPQTSADSASAPVVEIAPAPANDAQLAVDVAPATDDSLSGTVDIEPAPPANIRSAPKARTRAAEPADRAALIRQRWAETGIRMWNPRLHGTGEAALNIQGSVGLLPPAAGETMPRYDKLEFKMLGGQIVCEGVIVETPTQASHRSFTRLVEQRPIERVREPTRERQAVLA